jgi:hypothetical protein
VTCAELNFSRGNEIISCGREVDKDVHMSPLCQRRHKYMFISFKSVLSLSMEFNCQ